MKQLANVVDVHGRLMAEVLRPEACGSCRACRHGREERVLLPLPDGEYRPGDRIELNLRGGMLGRAALLAYGLPALALVLGLLIARALGGGELLQALGALLMVALSVLALRLLEPRLRRSDSFRPLPCCPQEGGD